MCAFALATITEVVRLLIDNLFGKRVLVTGASGFIGHHLCRRLTASGSSVFGVSRNLSAQCVSGIQWIQCDLSKVDAVERMLEKVQPQLIYHLASAVTGSRALEIVAPTFEANLLSTINLMLGATRIGGAKVVLAGSMEEPRTDENDAVPCSPYAAAKWAATLYGRMFSALYDLPVVTLRLFMVYGPEQRDSAKLVPFVVKSLLRGDAPRLTSGRRMIDWIYVDDVVDGLLTAATTRAAIGRSIDIGSGVRVSVRAIVEKITDIVASGVKPMFGAIPDRPFDTEFCADLTVARNILNWSPQIGLDEGLRRTVDRYRGQLNEVR